MLTVSEFKVLTRLILASLVTRDQSQRATVKLNLSK